MPQPLTDADSIAFRDVFSLGIMVTIAGTYTGWNAGLLAGCGSEILSLCLVGLAYIILVASMTEITSALPFGGSFGFCRCMLGFYYGFLMGIVEALLYILTVSSVTVTTAGLLVQVYYRYSYFPFIAVVY